MKKIGYYLIVILLLLLSWAFYSYLYKDHRDVTVEKEDFLVKTMSIYQEFLQDEGKATLKYGDKIIEVSGVITSIDSVEKTITLDEKMLVYWKDEINAKLIKSSTVKVKGRFLGYDNLLEEMKMDQAILME